MRALNVWYEALVQQERGVCRSKRFLALLFAVTVHIGAAASPARADDRPPGSPVAGSEGDKPWYERLHLRGYTQIRYNRIGASNPHLKNDQGDKSIGADGGFGFRRLRLIIFGDMAKFLSVYIQPDFASAIGDQLNVGIVRDWYTDIFLDDRREFRIRVGQSKVPYGWELMQSSQNRLPFDRSDALNSAFTNERDIGAHFMFAPDWVRKRFKHLVDDGLKGSGDYGMVAVGLINGQPLNSKEKNDNKHFVARVTYPFQIGAQTLELAAGGYTGLFVPTKGEGITGAKEFRDFRAHGTVVLYPQPIGFQFEYNAGVGPELDGTVIREKPLDGGYAMTMVRIPTNDFGVFTPYVRVHRYDGGKKFETSAPRHEVRELNAGVEWQYKKWLELTTEYMESARTVNGKEEAGRLLRLQLQFNY